MTEFVDETLLRQRRRSLAATAENFLLERRERGQETLDHADSIRFNAMRADLASIDDELQRCAAINRNPLLAGYGHTTTTTRTPGRPAVNDRNLVYRAGDNHVSWFKDLIHQAANLDPTGESRARLARHAEEVATSFEFQEHRDLSRVDGEGGYFVPPAWLVDQYIEFARPGRAFANLLQRRPLPGGTDSINTPRILTGTATSVQSADLQPVTETDLTDTFINSPVRTIAGQQGVALQLIDQSPIAFDDVIFRDLVSAYAVNVDTQALDGSGSNGEITGVSQTPGILTVACATQDIKGFYSALANAINLVLTTRFMPPTAIVVHPRRWAWLTSLLDQNSRPLFVPEAGGPFNAAGVIADVAPEGVVGRVLGLPVVVDANITTTAGASPGGQDVAYVLRAEDVVLYESGVRARVMPEPRADILSVLCQVYGYLAMAVRYPGSVCEITNLTAPTF
jgi:HK97 family phage major capsid protein